MNHGGKTNGYTVPNPNAQADLILDALKKANVDPETLSYIETHGTGTSLGDPIEITGLLKAFKVPPSKNSPVQSGRSNQISVILSRRPALHQSPKLYSRSDTSSWFLPTCRSSEPNIDFEHSPFYVHTKLTEWKRPAAHPRRVGVSSFGAGGSNAHLILEEYGDTREPERASPAISPEAFVLSARDEDALRRYAEKVVTFLEKGSDVSLANLAFTSQVGRTPMDARLVIVTSSVADLRIKLNQWISNTPGSEVCLLRQRQAGAVQRAPSD